MHKKKKISFVLLKLKISVWTIIKWIKRQDTDWEKIFAKHISDKRLVPKITKNSENSTMKKKFKNGQNKNGF